MTLAIRSGGSRRRLGHERLEDRVTPALSFIQPPVEYPGPGPIDTLGTFVYDKQFIHGRVNAAGDIDNDGFDDFVTASTIFDAKGNAVDSAYQVWRNDQTGRFPTLGSSGRLGLFEPESMNLIDLDADDKRDLVITFRESRRVVIYPGNGDGTFGGGLQLEKLATEVTGLAFGNFDDDGLPDIVTTAGSKIAVFLHATDGSVNPTAMQFERSGTDFTAVAAGDFNSDGVDEIVGTDAATGRLYLLERTDKTAFQFRATGLDGKGIPGDIQVADFNGDSRPDIVFASGARIGLFLNNGKGSFPNNPTLFTAPNNISKIEIADFDADNNNDLAVVYENVNGDSIATFQGRAGSFLAPQIWRALEPTYQFVNGSKVFLSEGIDPRDIAIGDFNNDRRPDWTVVNNEEFDDDNVLDEGTVGVGINNTVLVPTQIILQPAISSPTVGEAFPIKVSVATRRGVPVADYLGTVTFGSNDSKAILPANYAFTAGDQGVKLLDFTFFKSGTLTEPITVTATDVTDSGLTGSTDIIVSAGPAIRLAITGDGSTVVQGKDYNFTVQLLDQYDNIALSYNGRVVLSSSDKRATFFRDSNGTRESVAGERKVVQGNSDFIAVFASTGNQSITVTDTNNVALTGTINVTVTQPADPGEQPGETPIEPGFPIPTLPTGVAGGANPADMTLVAVGGPGQVRVFGADGKRLATVQTPGSAGTPRAGLADLNGDNIPEIISAAAPGGEPQVSIFDGKTGVLLRVIDAFERSFAGGLFVTVGDVDGDGFADAVITPDQGGGPRVRVVNLTTGVTIADFFGIEDPAFRGGARSALGDLNADGRLDVLVAAGFGGGPRVAGFDGKTVSLLPVKLFSDFFVFEETLRNGAFITSGDIDGDGSADLIAGGGPGGAPRVFAISGQPLAASGFQVPLANFFAGDTENRGGIRVTVKDIDGDDRADIVTGQGAGGTGVQYFAGKSITPTLAPPALVAFDVFDTNVVSGVFVG